MPIKDREWLRCCPSLCESETFSCFVLFHRTCHQTIAWHCPHAFSHPLHKPKQQHLQRTNYKRIKRCNKRRKSVSKQHERFIFADFIAPITWKRFQKRCGTFSNSFNQRKTRLGRTNRQQKHRQNGINHLGGGIREETDNAGVKYIRRKPENFFASRKFFWQKAEFDGTKLVDFWGKMFKIWLNF